MKSSSKISLSLALFIPVFLSVFWLNSISINIAAAQPPPEPSDYYVSFDEEADLGRACFYITLENLQGSDDNIPLKFLLNRTSIDIGKAAAKLWKEAEQEYQVTHCNTCDVESLECSVNNETKEEECLPYNISMTNCEKCGSWAETKKESVWTEIKPTNTERVIFSQEKTADKGYELNELRNSFEEILIKKSETKRLKLCYYFSEIPTNPLTGRPGSYGYMYMDAGGRLYSDFENSSWWNSSWNYGRTITVENINATDTLYANYTVNISVSTTDQSKFQSDCDDVRIAYKNSIELDRNITGCNTTNTQVWFQLQDNISTSSNSTDYMVYYGNPSAGAGPKNPLKTFLNVPEYLTNSVVIAHFFEYGDVRHINDSSQYKNNGTEVNSGNKQKVAGVYGEAINFSWTAGNTEYSIPLTASFNATAGQDQAIVFWMYYDGGTYNGQEVMIDSRLDSGEPGFMINVNDANGIYFNANGPGDSSITCNSTANAISRGKWASVAIAFNQSACSLYIDGKNINGTNGTAQGSLYINGNSIHIGGRYDTNPSNDFRGRIDNFMLFNTTITAKDIDRMVYFPINPPTYLGSEGVPLPQITIISPQNMTYNTTTIDLNWSADKVISWAAYSLNGGNNASLTSGCGTGHTDNNDGTCTAKLQTADMENVADIGAGSTGGCRDFQIRWNMSSMPAPTSRIINEAVLCVYWSDWIDSPDTDVNISRVLSQTWTESISAGEWNSMQFDTSSITSFSSAAKATWGCVNVTNIIKSDFTAGNNYSTIRLLDPDCVPGTITDPLYDNAALPFGNVSGNYLAAEDKENSNGTGKYPYLNITYYKAFNTTITTASSQNNVTVCGNASSGGINCSTVYFNVMMNVTFNIYSGETGANLTNVNVYCNNSWSGTIDSYDTIEFGPGSYSCVFERANYFNNTVNFIADTDKIVHVKMSVAGFLSAEEHTWLEWLYECWYNGDCRQTLDSIQNVVAVINQTTMQINETVNKVWSQFKRTDQSIVKNETTISSVVNSTSNITINYTVSIPAKEGYGLIAGIQGYDDFLPVRMSYWFLDYPSNNTCYSQGNYSVAVITPYCQPLTAYTIGQILTQLNFTVNMRPNLPAGNYTLVRSIEIDPDNVWIDYGQEIIGSVTILEDSKESDAKITGYGVPVLSDSEETDGDKFKTSEQKIGEGQKSEGSEGITGLATGNTFDTYYITVMISFIIMTIVVFIYKYGGRRKNHCGY